MDLWTVLKCSRAEEAVYEKNDTDVAKIPAVMELMEEKDCSSDKDAKRKLAELPDMLMQIADKAIKDRL